MQNGFVIPVIVALISIFSLSPQASAQANDVEVSAPGGEVVKFDDLKDSNKTSGSVFKKTAEGTWTQTGTWTRAQGQENVTRFNLSGDDVQLFHELGNENNENGPVEDLDGNDPLQGGSWQRNT
jgi:hypothetical protein